MIYLKVICDNHEWATHFNGTEADARAYFIGQTFTDEEYNGKEVRMTCKQVEFMYVTRFIGREIGAIGACHTIHTSLFAPDKDSALVRLYACFEHITEPEFRHSTEDAGPWRHNHLVHHIAYRPKQ